MIAAIFEYRYVPHMVAHQPHDGGFHLSIWADSVINIDFLDPHGNITCQFKFQAPPELIERCRNLTGHAYWWMKSLSMHHHTNFDYAEHLYDTVVRISEVDSYIRMDTLHELMKLDFATMSGHFGRLMYSLIEDVSALLQQYGFSLTINNFSWNSNAVTPILPQQHQPPMAQYPQQEYPQQQMYGN